MVFENRQQAGQFLAQKLSSFRGKAGNVIGIARGGVVVAGEVAKALSLPLDVVVVKKISGAFDPELAVGAAAPDNVSVVDYKFAQRLGIDTRLLQEEIRRKSEIVKQSMQLYRKGKPPFILANKTVIVVDDGIATGATIESAIKWLKKEHAGRIIAALPVIPKDMVFKIKPEVDELIVLDTPDNFASVGQFYRQFPQVEDEEVIQLLRDQPSTEFKS